MFIYIFFTDAKMRICEMEEVTVQMEEEEKEEEEDQEVEEAWKHE